VEHLHDFGLSRDPFSNDPVPGFYYASPVHRGAERRLGRAIAQHRGLCLLTGEPGAGKSFLARRLLASLEEEAYEANLLVLVHSGLDAGWLLSRLGRALGGEADAEEPLAVLARIYDRLCALREEGRRAVLFLDDAHLLETRQHMESLRGLVDLEYEDRHLVTLVLVGRPSLEETLALDPCLPDRVEVRVALERLDAPAASAYLNHRLQTAGGHPTLLAPEAAEAIARWSQGLPRRMNVLADNALFEAHLADRSRILVEDVERAARALHLESVAVGSLADSLPVHGEEPPGGEPLDLGAEEPAPSRAADLDAGPADTDLAASPGTSQAEQRSGANGAGLRELDLDEARDEDDALPALEALDEEKEEPEEAPVFELEALSEADPDSGEDGVDRDVEDLFERLVDE